MILAPELHRKNEHLLSSIKDFDLINDLFKRARHLADNGFIPVRLQIDAG